MTMKPTAPTPTPQTGTLIKDPYGQFRYIDPSQVDEAVKTGGFRLPSSTEMQDFQLKSEHGDSPVKAFLESAAGSASFGASRHLENALGITTPEAQAARAKFNPVASGLGEVAGIAAPLLAPETGLAGLLAKPVQGVAEAGQAVAKAATPLAEKAAGLAFNPATSPIKNRMLSQAAATGLGSAVEGAAFGLGQSVNEAALGDPHLNAEKVLSNIGYSSLFAGGVGGVVGALGGAFRKAGVAAEPEAAKAGATANQALEEAGFKVAPDMTEAENLARYGVPGTDPGVSLRGSLGINAAETEQQRSIIQGLKELKPEAAEIAESLRAIGAPAPEGMFSASPEIQRVESMLMNSPGPTGIERNRLYGKVYEAADNAVQGSLGKGADLSKAELGEALKAGIGTKMEAKIAPVQAAYAEIEGMLPAIPVGERSTAKIGSNILKIIEEHGLIEGTAEHSFVTNFARGLDQVTDLQRLKQFRTALGRATTPETRFVSQLIKEKLDNLEMRAIRRVADEMKTPEAKAKIMGLIEQIENAKAGYKALREEMEAIGKPLWGKARIYGPQDFLDKIDAMGAEAFAKKLLTKDNVALRSFMLKNFPEETKLLMQYERAAIRDAAMVKGEFRPSKAIELVNDLPKEIRGMIFSPEELAKMGHAERVLKNIPRDFNPSHTSHMDAYREFYSHPIRATIGEIRNRAAMGMIQGTVGKSPGYIEALAHLERMAQKTSKAVAQGSKAIFDTGSKAALPAIGFAGSKQASSEPKKREALYSQVREMQADPEKFMDHLERSTRSLHAVAPNLTGGFHETAFRATSFLASKLPVPPPRKPLSPPYVMSQAETEKFERSLHAVENPLTVLHQIKDGTLTHEAVEAVSTVYPKLYAEMKTQLLDRLTDHTSKEDYESIPYSTQISLSLFLQEDIGSGLDQASIAMNQATFQQSQQPQGGQSGTVRPSQQGLSALTKSERIRTPLQASAIRQDS
jgi:hypothetical protein